MAKTMLETRALAEKVFPDHERAEFCDAIEDAVEDCCERFGVGIDDADKLSAMYASMLVHALWALVDIGVDVDTLRVIADNAVHDAGVMAEVRAMTETPTANA